MPQNPVETYFRELHEIHRSGAGVKETSYYPALSALLNEIGKTLKPKVKCIINLANRGAGLPDGGFFTPDQFQRGEDEPSQGALPSRGALEVKGAGEDAIKIGQSKQVQDYLKRYGLVLVTNLRDFVLMGLDEHGHARQLERYTLAESEAEFWKALSNPTAFAAQHAERLSEYLRRAMLHAAPLSRPEDVAWFLASYARDARSRVEQVNNLEALTVLRENLEEGLGLNFDGPRGEHFFRSTLVQTLFYGLFSAWVIWCEDHSEDEKFDWRLAGWELHLPIIKALFEQLATPSKLQALGLVEVMDWAAGVLNRVIRSEFFKRFEQSQAVRYFYEPFLEAFDPVLRKDFGVWYTPPEVVRYMVERVDTVLKTELGLPLGLADENVVVLDPCTGTGSFLLEIISHIHKTLAAEGQLDALSGHDLKQIVTNRIFGFEIMPAPFVVAHLQIGLLLKHLGSPLSPDERPAVYLTNALTGWTASGKQGAVGFKEIREERDAANEIKQQKKILVVIGNPPYDGFAGVAIGEERGLSDAYRTVKRVPKPEGQGLNELYTRFYRLAERSIAENTGRGVICYITNFSWLNGLSFTGMRERFSEAFDRIWIDNLNGDSRETGKVAPDGSPDPSIFSTPQNREGIQVGTAIALMVRKDSTPKTAEILYRDLWGPNKHAQLTETARQTDNSLYEILQPAVELGLPFRPAKTSADYLKWPTLPELFPVSFPGVKTSRDELVVDIDRERLEQRMREHLSEVDSKNSFDREKIIRYLYRPFDQRWLYWETEGKLLDRPRPEYARHVMQGNAWFSAGQRNRKEDFYQPQVTSNLADHHIVESNVGMFPLFLRHEVTLGTGEVITEQEPNLSPKASALLRELGLQPEDLFYHAVAVMHAPAYRQENAGALRQDWPRIPLPQDSELLRASAKLGRQVAALLDPTQAVPGVTTGSIRPELAQIAVVSRVGGGNLRPEELGLSARWGYYTNGKIMPGPGRKVERVENGNKVFDIYINDVAYWRGVPEAVWEYTLGGYQVVKKWLSYREESVLGRKLKPEEVREVTAMCRRIAALLLLERDLDNNYRKVSAVSTTAFV